MIESAASRLPAGRDDRSDSMRHFIDLMRRTLSVKCGCLVGCHRQYAVNLTDSRNEPDLRSSVHDINRVEWNGLQ